MIQSASITGYALSASFNIIDEKYDYLKNCEDLVYNLGTKNKYNRIADLYSRDSYYMILPPNKRILYAKAQTLCYDNDGSIWEYLLDEIAKDEIYSTTFCDEFPNCPDCDECKLRSFCYVEAYENIFNKK